MASPSPILEAKKRLKSYYLHNMLRVGYGLYDSTDVAELEHSGRQVDGAAPSSANADHFPANTALERSYVDTYFVMQEELVEEFQLANCGSSQAAGAFHLEHTLQCSSARRLGLSELFPLQDAPPSVLIQGSAGMGKTSAVCVKLPYDWARGRALADVDLLVWLDLGEERHWRYESLEQLLCETMDFGSSELKATMPYIRATPGCVCLVMDAFERCDVAQCTPFMCSVVRATHSGDRCGVRTVVATRPCRAAHDLVERGQFARRLEMVGFDRHAVAAAMCQSLQSPHPAADLYPSLKESKAAESLLCTPFVGGKICEQFGANGQLASCNTALYESMMLRLFEVQTEMTIDGFSRLPHSQRRIMLELGNFAFQLLLQERFVFDEVELWSVDLCPEAMTLGVFVSCATRQRVRLYRFSHLKLQAYLAAVAVADSIVASAEDVDNVAQMLGCRRTDHFRAFWRFLYDQLAKVDQAAALVQASKRQARGVLTMGLSQRLVQGLAECSDDDGACPGHGRRALACIDPAEMEEVHKVLLEQLKIGEMRRLADKLLGGLVCGGRVDATMETRMRSLGVMRRDDHFLAEMLKLWCKLAPQASRYVLFRALLKVDYTAAASIAQLLLPPEHVRALLPPVPK